MAGLPGKVVIVTGVATGCGRVLAEAFAGGCEARRR
jgi:NAD(P)-dependent dehydrogenase (short-subunit alcohol dehydrogenase family)